MVSPEGGFYSTQDADSEGEEGKFFTGQRRRLKSALLPEDAQLFMLYYDVTQGRKFRRKEHSPRGTGC